MREWAGAAEQHHRAQRHVGVREPGDGVGDAGAGGDRSHAGLAGGERPTLGHVGGGLLVAGVDDADALVLGSRRAASRCGRPAGRRGGLHARGGEGPGDQASSVVLVVHGVPRSCSSRPQVRVRGWLAGLATLVARVCGRDHSKRHDAREKPHMPVRANPPIHRRRPSPVSSPVHLRQGDLGVALRQLHRHLLLPRVLQRREGPLRGAVRHLPSGRSPACPTATPWAARRAAAWSAQIDSRDRVLHPLRRKW